MSKVSKNLRGKTTLYHNTPEAKSFRVKKLPVSSFTKEELAGSIQTFLGPLVSAYDKIADAVQVERNKKLSMQTYIGESVMYELLHQSYDTSEYPVEERFKRLLSAVMKAIEARQNEKRPDPLSPIYDIWEKPEDSHSLHIESPDTATIQLRKICELAKSENKTLVIEDIRHDILIQVDGKTVNELFIAANLSEEDLETLGKKRAESSLHNKKIIKTVIIPNKLVNFITASSKIKSK